VGLGLPGRWLTAQHTGLGPFGPTVWVLHYMISPEPVGGVVPHRASMALTMGIANRRGLHVVGS